MPLHPSPAGTALHNFCELFGLSQLVDRGIHKEAILDFAISEHIETVFYYPHLGTSDHLAVFVNFNTGLQVPPSLPSISLEICPLEPSLWVFLSSFMEFLEVRLYF